MRRKQLIIVFFVAECIFIFYMVSRTSTVSSKHSEIKRNHSQVEAWKMKMTYPLEQLRQERDGVKAVPVVNKDVTKNLAVTPVSDKSESRPVLVKNTSKEAAVIPVLMMACNRPDAIKRSLDQLIHLPHDPVKHPIIVSQDCGDQQTADVVRSYGEKVQLLQHKNNSEINLPPKEKYSLGYYKIARHYKWALTQVFDVLNHDVIIIVEDDLDFAPDFYEYFDSTYHILHTDPTLWCVSAWNDNGMEGKVADLPELLHRTDFFPGLGWMMEKDIWSELKEKWPAVFWDDWMRLPEQRKDRACIRPEVSRTKTFGEKGVSNGMFYKKYLKFIKLNDKKVEFTKKDLSYLMKSQYDIQFIAQVYGCRQVSIDEATSGNLTKEDCVRVQYSTQMSFREYANSLGIMEDIWSKIPRTGYLGVVSSMVGNRRVYVAPFPNRTYRKILHEVGIDWQGKKIK